MNSFAPIHFSQYNVFEDPSERFLEFFDVINVQLTLTFVGDADILQVFKDISAMLKPGGWLQWTELDPVNQELYGGIKFADIHYMDKMWSECCKLYDSQMPGWPSTLDSVFEQFQFTNVEKVTPQQPDVPMLHAWTEQHLVAYLETLETFKTLRGDSASMTSRAERFRGLVEKASEEYETTKAGVWIPLVRVVGQKLTENNAGIPSHPSDK